MPLHIVNSDITSMKVDAIVNSTNHNMYGYSGVDYLLHEIGGPQFDAECEALRDKCVPGEAVYTNAYNMDCKYIIHTIAMYWQGGTIGEAAILRSCYKSSLEVAAELGCKSVAFPLISAGNRSFPVADALKNAAISINEYLSLNADVDVYLVLFGSVVTQIAETVFGDLDKYLAAPAAPVTSVKDLDELLKTPGEGFVDMLYRLMDEKGIDKASDLYKKAGVTKGTFSKLISGGSKKPSLETAVGLAMALKLSYDEAVKFLASGGLALSEGSDYDRIVSFYLKTQNYDIWDMDVQLMRKGYKSILGCD